jgi:hypothetical protein
MRLIGCSAIVASHYGSPRPYAAVLPGVPSGSHLGTTSEASRQLR